MLLGVSNFLQTFFYRIYVRIPAKYGVCGSTGLDATPTVQIHICHPVLSDIRSGFKTFWTLTPAFLAVFLIKISLHKWFN